MYSSTNYLWQAQYPFYSNCSSCYPFSKDTNELSLTCKGSNAFLQLNIIIILYSKHNERQSKMANIRVSYEIIAMEIENKKTKVTDMIKFY